MAFRADEAMKNGLERAMRYLVPKEIPPSERAASRELVGDLIDRCGSVVESYPSWHPIVSANDEIHSPITRPSRECGYLGLDHTLLFANGFITCPYKDGQKVLDSVENLPCNAVAEITAERLKIPLYNVGTDPILVICNWRDLLPNDGMIPKALAVPLMLEQEMRGWQDADVAETWETMQPYFMGAPHGSRSSLIVNQETGQAMKKIWNDLIYTGMYGPIRV
jgi:hypothetical protein